MAPRRGQVSTWCIRGANQLHPSEVRRVRRNGGIKWRGNTIYIGEAMIGEPVGLIEDEHGDWANHYGPIVLGVIAHRGDRLRKPKRVACGPQRGALPTGATGATTTATAATLNKT